MMKKKGLVQVPKTICFGHMAYGTVTRSLPCFTFCVSQLPLETGDTADLSSHGGTYCITLRNLCLYLAWPRGILDEKGLQLAIDWLELIGLFVGKSFECISTGIFDQQSLLRTHYVNQGDAYGLDGRLTWCHCLYLCIGISKAGRSSGLFAVYHSDFGGFVLTALGLADSFSPAMFEIGQFRRCTRTSDTTCILVYNAR